ncbi:hypothetical protein VE03_09560 [Pseudogymnoascus sp. 23342-1-I1]|nr:hypothetical protein VE03_09560 [Pseudogymnoascus sp. 23342-1-I1]
MPPSTPQREVIEISDSPTAQPEVIEISDDEVTELPNCQANIPHIHPIKLAYESEGDADPGTIKSELVDIRGSSDRPMVSPEPVMPFRSLSLGHGHPASEISCLDVLDRELGEISKEIEKDKALQTTQILQDIRFQIQFTPTDTASHTLSLPSLETPRQGGVSTPSINIAHYAAKKSGSSRAFAAKTIQTPPRTVPKYTSYIEIERSVLANRTRLPPEPTVPENNSNSKDAVKAAILKSMHLCNKLAKQSRGSETLSHIGTYLPQIRSAYQDCRNSLEEEGIYESLDYKDAKHPGYHVEKAFGMPSGSFLDLETHVAIPQKSPTASPNPLANTLEGYARESCLICSAHQCNIHGKFDDVDDGKEGNASDTTEEGNTSKGDAATYQIYSMPHTHVGTHYRGGGSIGNGSENGNNSDSDSDSDYSEQSQRYYCSAACQLNPSNTELNNEGFWSEGNYALMQVLAETMPLHTNRKASCLIAPMLGKPCSEVHYHFKKLSSQRVGLDKMVADDDRRSKKLDWRDLGREHKHHERLQPRPCYHPGQNCVAAGEKCTCAMHDTLDAAAPSHASFKNAHAAVSIENATQISATNVESPNQLGLKAQFWTPIATTAKFNAVRGKNEPVQKGDFIAEYVGEIIGDAEANRRGALLKGIGMSYNFTLNAEMTIDAMWFGNATRFINHSEQGKNCQAKVLLVNSEHRIAFFATENINAGEELFFDYGKEFQGVEKLKESARSSKAERKSAKQQRAEPLESTIADTEAGLGSGVDGDDERGGESFVDWHARTAKTQRKRPTSDDDDDYIERGSQQGPRRARPPLRNRRGRR